MHQKHKKTSAVVMIVTLMLILGMAVGCDDESSPTDTGAMPDMTTTAGTPESSATSTDMPDQTTGQSLQKGVRYDRDGNIVERHDGEYEQVELGETHYHATMNLELTAPKGWEKDFASSSTIHFRSTQNPDNQIQVFRGLRHHMYGMDFQSLSTTMLINEVFTVWFDEEDTQLRAGYMQLGTVHDSLETKHGTADTQELKVQVMTEAATKSRYLKANAYYLVFGDSAYFVVSMTTDDGPDLKNEVGSIIDSFRFVGGDEQTEGLDEIIAQGSRFTDEKHGISFWLPDVFEAHEFSDRIILRSQTDETSPLFQMQIALFPARENHLQDPNQPITLTDPAEQLGQRIAASLLQRQHGGPSEYEVRYHFIRLKETPVYRRSADGDEIVMMQFENCTEPRTAYEKFLMPDGGVVDSDMLILTQKSHPGDSYAINVSSPAGAVYSRLKVLDYIANTVQVE